MTIYLMDLECRYSFINDFSYEFQVIINSASHSEPLSPENMFQS